MTSGRPATSERESELPDHERDGETEAAEGVETPGSIDVQPEDPGHPGRESPEPID